LFDAIDSRYLTDEVGIADTYTLSKRLQEFAENVISDSGEGLAVDYARAFLAEVNFYEIAQHLIDAARTEAV
jgi:hypothetical protein